MMEGLDIESPRAGADEGRLGSDPLDDTALNNGKKIMAEPVTARDPSGQIYSPGGEIISSCRVGSGRILSKVMLVEFETDPALVRALLPEPLELVSPSKMTLFFNEMQAQYEDGSLRPPYYELVVGIAAKYGDRAGLYNVQLLLDQTEPGSQVAPTVAGLMIYGYPKREANFVQRQGDRALVSKIRRRGRLVTSAEFRLGDAKEAKAPIPDQASFGVKYVPSAEIGRMYDVLKLLTWDVCEVMLTSYRSAEVISIAEELWLDGLDYPIPVKRVTRCGYSESSFGLGPASVVWDYLQPNHGAEG